MSRRARDGDRRRTSSAPDGEFDPDAFWRDHPHLIRAIRGPHERDASSLPFRRPIDVDELEGLLDAADPVEPVLDLRSEPLPTRACASPSEHSGPAGQGESTGVVDARPTADPDGAPIIDLTARLALRRPSVQADTDPYDIPVVSGRLAPEATRSEWLDDVTEQQLRLTGEPTDEASEAEALRFARRIRRARQRTVSTPLTEWDPPRA